MQIKTKELDIIETRVEKGVDLGFIIKDPLFFNLVF